MISIIVAVAENGVIGDGERMPWHISADLKHFKEITTGHSVIMGRKTFESLGRPLPNRRNIVITRDVTYTAVGVEVVHSLEEAIALTKDNDNFIIGGGEIYRQAMPFADRLYITHIRATFEGKTTFPEIDEKHWHIVEQSETFEENGIRFEYITYERV